MAEFDQGRANPGVTDNAEAKSADSAPAQFIRIKTLPRVAYARDLRLRDGDILVAIDGALNNSDIDAFRVLCDQAQESQKELLLTICRNDIVYDVLIEKRLGVELDYADAEASIAAGVLFAKHHMGPKDHYQNYEALRDIQRHVVLYDTAYSAMATLAPPIWLLQHRAWEPLAAVIAAYAASAAVHWGLFFATAILLAIYFHRIQFRLIRNYSLFTEHYFWHVCAARSAAEAQMVCRQLDPKCQFSYSYVGPPASSSEPSPSN